MYDHPPFFSGTLQSSSNPLQHFVPRLESGVAEKWIQYLDIGNGWVLDPFGASPHLLVELANAGANVLVTVNNPVLNTYLYLLANRPERGTLARLVDKLGASIIRVNRTRYPNKIPKRFETIIKELYDTQCTNCKHTAQAVEFIWDKAADQPVRKSYKCSTCLYAAEDQVNHEDIDQAATFQNNAIYRAQAVSKITNFTDHARSYVESIIDIYLPRTINAIVLTLQRLDLLEMSEQERNYLNALLISTFDQTTTLWPPDATRESPRQLVAPAFFRETNFWLVFEEQIEKWSSFTNKPVPLIYEQDPHFGDVSQGPGIHVICGRFSESIEKIAKFDIKALVTVVPRYNQAFWALSAVWTAWLMGKEKLGSFYNVFNRRKYDWEWHTKALYSVFRRAYQLLPENAPVVLFPGSREVELTTSAAIAGKLSGFSMAGIAAREHRGYPQLLFSKKPTTPHSSHPLDIKTGLIEYLRQREEPADYFLSYLACLTTAIQQNSLPGVVNTGAGKLYHQLHNAIIRSLNDSGTFRVYGKNVKTPQSKHWWLYEDCATDSPLDDRIEKSIVTFARFHPAFNHAGINAALNHQFRGLFTPSPALVLACLNSYCTHADGWHLNHHETASRRESDLQKISGYIQSIGESLGYETTIQSSPLLKVTWMQNPEEEQFEFFITQNACLGKYLSVEQPENTGQYIIAPGSRANLIAFKLQNNLLFKEKFTGSFHFVKFRLIRKLFEGPENPTLTKNNIRYHLNLDTIEYVSEQLQLI